MIDIKILREDPDQIKTSIKKRGLSIDLKKISDLDRQVLNYIKKTDELRRQQNKLSKSEISESERSKLVILKNDLKEKLNKLKELRNTLNKELSEIPNLIFDEVPSGDKENNQIIELYKKKSEFKFKNKDHIKLTSDLDIVDYERGAKMSGSGFWIYKKQGAELEWALLNYFIDFHRQNNYTFIIPPFLLTQESAYISGHLPKFKDDLYWTEEKLCLNATSEMMLGNLHRNEILKEEYLPIKYYAYSTCFRREAGAYRTEERGMVRGHQFNKIEMFQFTKPKNSDKAFNELFENAKKLVEGLDLHYQAVLLSAGDTSVAMAKTIDLEVWIPSMKKYKEVTSISNALDYQARRGNIKYKNITNNSNEYVHTLNASGLATSRLVPAILEQFQMNDGSVSIPKALHKYLPFKKIEIDE
ncbi:serine--tRNA ligase [Patescibacteria group bacterium]